MLRRVLLTLPLAAVAACFTLLAQAPAARAAEPVLKVAYAGSMGALMDKALGPAIQQQAHVQYQGQGAGAYGLARLLAGKQISADVFVSITPGPMQVLQKAGLVDVAVPVASTQMVIAYSPKSRYAKDFEAAAAGRTPWYAVLQKPGVKFGRTDPRTDPQGRNIVFAMLLAQIYYKQPGLAKAILGPVVNPAQIFAEPSLLSRLEAGQIDASSGYLSAVVSHKLPYIKLPNEINLSDPNLAAPWYDKVHFDLAQPDGKTETLSTQPLVFYAAVLKNAPNPKAGEAFIKLMRSPQGQAMFKHDGYSEPKGGDLR